MTFTSHMHRERKRIIKQMQNVENLLKLDKRYDSFNISVRVGSPQSNSLVFQMKNEIQKNQTNSLES